MKKIIVSALLGFYFIILSTGSSSALAQTADSATLQRMSASELERYLPLLREYGRLKQQLAELQARADQQSRQQSEEKIRTDSSSCHTFNTNLSIGMNGSEVTALQNALTKAGFVVSATGNFGEATAAAVSAFQIRHRDDILTPNDLVAPTGYFGPATRAVMNRLYGCEKSTVDRPPTPTPGSASALFITSPTDGSYQVGSSLNVTWASSSNISPGALVNIGVMNSNGTANASYLANTINDGAQMLTLRSDTPAGQYRVQITTTVNNQLIGAYSNWFNVVAQPILSSATPSINVSSPPVSPTATYSSTNGPVINWSSANLPSSSVITVGLFTVTNQPVAGFQSFTTTNTGSVSGRLTGSSISSGDYYYRLSTEINRQIFYGGSGVFHFTGISQTPSPTATPYTISTQVIPGGTGQTITRSSPGPYPPNTFVNLTANPAAGYTFSSWSGCSGTGTVCSVVMDGNKIVTANFIANTTTPPPTQPPATPSITVSSPANNSSWTMTNGPVIIWSSNIPSGNVITVELLTPSNGSVSGFSSFTTTNDGSESGRLTNSAIASGTYYFRLSTVVNGQTIYGGSGVFQFTQPAAAASITVSSPAADSTWSPTNSPVVSWTTVGVTDSQNVLIELLTPTNGSVPGFTSRSVRNDQRPAFNLLTGSTVAPGAYYFRLSTVVNGQTIYGGSGVFQFTQPAAAAPVVITAPTSGSFPAGSPLTVTWTTTGITPIPVNISEAPITLMLAVDESMATTYFLAWSAYDNQEQVVIPSSVPSGSYKIRVAVPGYGQSTYFGWSNPLQITR